MPIRHSCYCGHYCFQAFVRSGLDCPISGVVLPDCRLTKHSAWRESSCSELDWFMVQYLRMLCRIDWLSPSMNNLWRGIRLRRVSSVWLSSIVPECTRLCFDLQPAWNSWSPYRLQQWCHRLHMLPKNNWGIGSLMSTSLVDGRGSVWTTRQVRWRQLRRTSSWRSIMNILRTFMNRISAAGYLESRVEGEDFDRVGAIEHLPLQMYLGTSPLFLPFSLRHRHRDIETCWRNCNCGSPGLLCSMCWPARWWFLTVSTDATTVAVFVHRMATVAASTLGWSIRLGFGYGILFIPY